MSAEITDTAPAAREKGVINNRWVHLKDAGAVALLAALSAYLFRYHIIGTFTFLGNPDRLNNNLKVLKYYVDSLASGGLSAWNETELLGYDSFSLPYTFPNPLAYLTYWFGPDNIYITAGFLTTALLAAAGISAYAFIREVVQRRGPALVGAILYEFAAITTLKVSQNDMSFAVFILIPLLAFAVRRITTRNLISSFVLTALLLVFMLQFTFLQKAAYAVMLTGTYAAYRSCVRWDWRPLAVFAAALAVSAIATIPRFRSLAMMMTEYVRHAPRTEVEPHSVFPIEILRWFDETIFGQYLSDATAKLNMINLSEGFLLYTSSLVPFVIIFGLVKYRSRWLGLLTERRDDTAFFFWAAAFTFAVTLSQPVLLLVYDLFLKLDFIHARILIAGLLPLTCLVALLLREWSPPPDAAPAGKRLVFIVGAASLTALLINFTIETAASHWDRTWLLPAAYDPNYNFGTDRTFQAISRAAVARIALSGLCTVLLLAVLRKGGSSPARSVYAYHVLLFLVPLQALSGADFRTNDAHTWNTTVPFPNGDIYQAPRSDFSPPSADEIKALHARLQPDQYRSVVLCDEKSAGGFCAGHIGQFWRLRLVDGYYGVGVPARIAVLPWQDRLGMRSVSFSSNTKLPWPLLALLNVKYAVGGSDAFYRNTFPRVSSVHAANFVSSLQIDENPFPVTPRAFFARTAQPAASAADAASKLFQGGEVTDVQQTSFVEGLPRTTEFSTYGGIEFKSRGDHLEIVVEPAAQARFLVINELYYPGWRGEVDGKPAAIYPTNAVMRGIELPPGARVVALSYVPPTKGAAAALFYAVALSIAALVIVFLRRIPVSISPRPAQAASASHDSRLRRQINKIFSIARQLDMQRLSDSFRHYLDKPMTLGSFVRWLVAAGRSSTHWLITRIDTPITARGLVWLCGTFLVWWFLIRTAGKLVPHPSDFVQLFRLVFSKISNAGPIKDLNLERLSIAATWLFMGAGLLALPLGSRLRSRPPSYPRPSAAPGTALVHRRTIDWTLRFVLVGAFCSAVWFLKGIDIGWSDFHRTGPAILGYSVFRFILFLSVLILCFSLGALALKSAASNFHRESIDDLPYVTLCFFLGATIYGIAVTILGLFGLLNLPLALLITIPVLLAGAEPLRETFCSLANQLRNVLLEPDKRDFIVTFLLAWCLIALIAILIVSRGLYPVTLDNDVWEHYFHYYREVLRTGSVAPNEIWYHFYISKAAGLFFLFGIVSDFFAPQFVSLCFVLMAGLVIFQVIRFLGIQRSWAVLAVIVFFSYFYFDLAYGTLFKHHAIFLGYVAFLVWLVLTLPITASVNRRALIACGSLAAFYICFYQTIPSIIIVCSFALLAMVSAYLREPRQLVRSHLLFMSMGIAGTLIALTLNYLMTGLPEIAPIRLLWSIADHEKVTRVFGDSGPLYFLAANNDLPGDFDTTGRWLREIFRYDYFSFLLRGYVMLLALLLALAAAMRLIDNAVWERYRPVILVLSAWLIPATLFGHFLQLDSVARLFIFTVFLLSIAGVVAAHGVVDGFIAPGLKRGFSSVLALLLCGVAVSQGILGAGNRWVVFAPFVMGKLSLSDALQRSEFGLHSDKRVKLSQLSKVREVTGPAERIVTLTYDPGFTYTLPGRGMISEPSYSLGPHYREIIFGPPERASALLRELKVNYFFINLGTRLYASVAFSRLFAPETLAQHFKLAFQDGNNYVLTWRTGSNDLELPKELVSSFELKRTGILHYPFSGRSIEDIQNIIRTLLGESATYGRNHDLTDRSVRAMFSANLSREVSGLWRSRMLDGVHLTENVRVLEKLLRQVDAALAKRIPDVVAEARNAADPTAAFEANDSFVATLGERVVKEARLFFRAQYNDNFDAEFSEASVAYDDKFPFGLIYESEGSLNRRLGR